MSAGTRKAALFAVGGGMAAFSSAYVTYHTVRMNKEFEAKKATKPSDFSFVSNPNRNDQYQEVANSYDKAIDMDEFYLGIKLLRRWLLTTHARGTVLEMGAGTARNIHYYPSATVGRVLLTDASEKMIHEAKTKVSSLGSTQAQRRFAFLVGDASDLDLPSDAFDTVVDTFGLCSYDDPVKVLNEMGRLCKPDGKILLLEHGRSKSWSFVTKHLDKHAEQHAANWGCVWNRDLDRLLEASNLQVETICRYHLGTTYYVVCRPETSDTETVG